jgi:arylsulfatase A-like enzyme
MTSGLWERKGRSAGWKRRIRLAEAIAVSLLAISACRGSPPGEHPSIVLIVVDTLRADHLGCYGADPRATPALSALAARGVQFRTTLAASSWTGPSVCAIVTGRYPDHVGVHGLRDPLPASAVTFAQRLKAVGYRTGAVVSNPLAGPAYGYDRGYDSFHLERYRVKSKEGRALPAFTADQVTDRALEWLRAPAESGPFFLYVHYTDPHEPYLPPPPWKPRSFAGDGRIDRQFLLDVAFKGAPLLPSQLEAIRARYEGEVAFTDHEVGRLIEALPAGTLVAFTGDHGEELREHGGFLHGFTLFHEVVRVPLLIAGPGVPAGRVVEEGASQVDIVPTLLDLAGLDGSDAAEAPGFDGRSLTPLFRTPPAPVAPRPLFAMLEKGRRRWYVVQQGQWVLHYFARRKKPVLFDLEADPAEQHNVAAEHPEVVESLLHAYRERMRHAATPAAPVDPKLRKQLEEELRGIGYVE